MKKKKSSEGVTEPCWQTGKPLLVNWLAHACIFSLNLFSVNVVIMALKCFWYMGNSITKTNTLLCLTCFPLLLSYYAIWKTRKMLD